MNTRNHILQRAREIEPRIIEWRRDIHMHPELGFEEIRTAKLVAEELHRLGMEVEVGVGKTGVVARLGEGSPVVGIRADMDALPIQEENDVSYASRFPGKMHACGHDAHTAILLGVANILNDLPERPAGEIRFLFQPSEEDQDDEDKSGALRMVEEGALDGVDAVIALHVNSKSPAGKFHVGSGKVQAAVDSFNAVIRGKGAHGASPHFGIDPIYLLAQVTNAIHGIRARRVDPTKPALISIGYVHGGAATNVIPSEVAIGGTLRSYDPKVREQLLEELHRAFDVAKALGGDYEMKIQRGYPSMNNEPGVTDTLHTVISDMFGGDNIKPFNPEMGAEDFSYMQECAPGSMFLLGVQIGNDDRPHHNPNFDVEELVLYQGAAVLAEAACRLLREKAG